MTHPLHEYLAAQVAVRLAQRRVVVWYDPRAEFAPFINELRGQPADAPLTDERVERVTPGQQSAALACYDGSFFAVRVIVEPLVAIDQPDPLLIYLPGVTRDETRSPLLELEQGGTTYEPQLKRQTRNVLLHLGHTDGVIDEMLASEGLRYADIAALIAATAEGGGQPALLRVIFPGTRDNAALVAAWLADPATDAALGEKGATGELYKLVGSRLGLGLELSAPLAESRSRLLRFLLAGEFRADLACPPPPILSQVPEPATKEQGAFLREVIGRLRQEHADPYIAHADTIAGEFSLATAGVSALDLGAIDTFRFEERALLDQCDTLLAEGEYARVGHLVAERASSFWVDRDVARRAQWRACELVAQLLGACRAVGAELAKSGHDPAAWVAAYTRDDGWYRLDQGHRQLESWLANLDDEPTLGRSIALARGEYDALTRRLAEGFGRALRGADWQIPGVQPQTRIYDDAVAAQHGTVALVLVDALRYEMGQELAQQLRPLGELRLTPALGVLPAITKLGMAAFLPGAAASYNVVEERGKLAASVDGTPLPDLAARQKFLAARVPQTVDLELAELLVSPAKQLGGRFKDARLIVVRSQEIDSLGEAGHTHLARQVMDAMIANVARGVRKLAALGVERIVVSADHGHLFAQERGDDMKTESPGPAVELHRRCWIGRGGSTPPGAVRVTGADLGYQTDLDFIFPTGLGVFKAGGGLAYHHGGVTLQELVIPVVQLRVPQRKTASAAALRVIIGGQPTTLTNRTLGVTLTLLGDLFTEPTRVRPILLAGSEQVGYAGMALGAELDAATGTVLLTPGATANVGLMLTRDDCAGVRIVVQHPVTDAALGQTDEIPVRLGL